MFDDVDKCCRLCLDVEANHVSIRQDYSIQLHLKSCLGITITLSDNMPKEMCINCATKLKEFYNFQLNAKCSQEWLESIFQEKSKKCNDSKMTVQPLPDSEYNSDSLLEFLNNTANIEEYLNNLGKDDFPTIVNILDKNNENCLDTLNKQNKIKNASPKKRDITQTTADMKMKIDMLDSDIEIVKGILMKENKSQIKTNDKCNSCFACKTPCDNLQKLSQHLSTCEYASRTCIFCKNVFDSRLQMIKHKVTKHIPLPFTCSCGKTFTTKDKTVQHFKVCRSMDFAMLNNCIFRCKQCKDTFTDRLQLYRHARDHIQKNDQKTCDICGHKFVDINLLKKHRKEVHNKAEEYLYRCKLCQLTLPNHKEMYQHVLKHTTNYPKVHLCESCGHSFSSRTTLLRHLLLHNSYKCDVCSKKFMNENERDNHLLQHNVETVMCERCGQTVICHKINLHFCL